ncbi:hypothetical protein HY490_00425 [Candidatus Woesearchaeota archaeon]|nr:hypothetical protein [Candidatus Woesearchaeota archaeon]
MTDDDIAEQAMKKAKEVENIPAPSDEEIVEIYKDGIAQGEKLKKLLKTDWYLKDKDVQATTPKK